MPLGTHIRMALKRFAEKVLDIDDTQVPEQQVKILFDTLARKSFETNAKELGKLVKQLQKKHLVDSICIASRNGSLIVSSNGSGLNEALTGSALFNYILSEIPSSEAIFIKEKDWYMLLPFREKIYIIRAGENLTRTELNVMAKEVEQFLKRQETKAL
ncbi:MAG: hypothetical protein V1494_00395 [Candidatus Diapherotrites archaeon]